LVRERKIRIIENKKKKDPISQGLSSQGKNTKTRPELVGWGKRWPDRESVSREGARLKGGTQRNIMFEKKGLRAVTGEITIGKGGLQKQKSWGGGRPWQLVVRNF